MELPYTFVSYRGSVGQSFKMQNYCLLECMEKVSWRGVWLFMNSYWMKSKVSDSPVTERLPFPLQVRVGEPVLSKEAIKEGSRKYNVVWHDEWTENICTFDYSGEYGEENQKHVCVLNKDAVPKWLRSGCYTASYCMNGPRECWVEGKEGFMTDNHFSMNSGAHASIVITLEKYERALDKAMDDVKVKGAGKGDAEPFPKTLREFVTSFRATFKI